MEKLVNLKRIQKNTRTNVDLIEKSLIKIRDFKESYLQNLFDSKMKFSREKIRKKKVLCFINNRVRE